MNQPATDGVWETHCPPQIASSTSMKPRAEVSSTLPGRRRAQIHAHQKRDGNRHRNRERSPGAGLQRIHHDQGANSEQDHDDADHGHVSHQAAQAANFVTRHFGQRLSIASHGKEQNHEILHAAAEDRTGKYPESAGKIAELRRQHRADQRAGSGDGGEMVPEDHPFVGGNKVAAIFQPLGRCGALSIQDQHFGRDELAVETVTERVGADGRDHQPHGIDLLAPMERDCGQSQGSQHCDRQPGQYAEEFWA